MKYILITTIAAVVLLGCATPEPTATLAPGTPIWAAAEARHRDIVLRHLSAGLQQGRSVYSYKLMNGRTQRINA